VRISIDADQSAASFRTASSERFEVIEKTGVRAYAFLTEPFVARAAFAERGLGLPRHVEEIPELGVVEGRVLDMAASVERYRAAARRYVGPDDADFEIAADLAAAPSFIWPYVVDAKRRLAWQRDTVSVANRASPEGRSGIGWESHCDHGSYRMNHRLVDWQPFDYLTLETTATGRSPVKPSPGHVTFELQPLGDDRCRIHMRVRTKGRSPWVRMKWALAKPLVRREWEKHLAALRQLVLDDAARANAASPPLPPPSADEGAAR
jgi:hypothetical protein